MYNVSFFIKVYQNTICLGFYFSIYFIMVFVNLRFHENDTFSENPAFASR